jgi:hypothetical protein
MLINFMVGEEIVRLYRPNKIKLPIEINFMMKTYPYFGTSAAKPVTQVGLLL